jgi:hypothetical protein
MVASLAISSQHLLCPTRERRPPTLATTRRTGPRHTAMRASTPASVSTHRWQGRSMAQNMIPPQRILTQRSSWGSEEVRRKDGTGLPMPQSTRPLLLHFLRSEQGARVRARPYDLGRTLHAIRYRHSRLFLLYPSFVDYYIPFLCIIVTLGWKLCRAGWKKRWGNDRSWSKGWVMYLLTCRVLALQRVYLRQLLCSRNLHHLIRTLLL